MFSYILQSFLRIKYSLSYSRNSLLFWTRKYIFCTYKPIICRYPQSDRFSSYIIYFMLWLLALRLTPYRIFATVYTKYSQLPSICFDSLCHAKVTTDLVVPVTLMFFINRVVYITVPSRYWSLSIRYFASDSGVDNKIWGMVNYTFHHEISL
jgi:hypothetical protein